MLQGEEVKSSKIIGKHILRYEKIKSNFISERKTISLQTILDQESQKLVFLGAGK